MVGVVVEQVAARGRPDTADNTVVGVTSNQCLQSGTIRVDHLDSATALEDDLVASGRPFRPTGLIRVEQFGIATDVADPALDVVRNGSTKSATQIVDDLFCATRKFAENRPQLDDISAIVVKVLPFVSADTSAELGVH